MSLNVSAKMTITILDSHPSHLSSSRGMLSIVILLARSQVGLEGGLEMRKGTHLPACQKGGQTKMEATSQNG